MRTSLYTRLQENDFPRMNLIEEKENQSNNTEPTRGWVVGARRKEREQGTTCQPNSLIKFGMRQTTDSTTCT